MFEAIQYFVSSKKLEDAFGIDIVAVVNGKRKITRLCDDNMGLDLQFICITVLLFICSPTYLCSNIAYHQTCWPLEGLWHIFVQDIHVLALHGPNG